MSNKIALVSLDFAGTGSMCGGNKELAMMDAQLVEATIKTYLAEIRCETSPRPTRHRHRPISAALEEGQSAGNVAIALQRAE